MLNTITTVVVVLLGVHVVAKFAFFALPYRKRRAALDKSYGEKPSATGTSDWITLGFTVVLCGLLLWRGVEAVSFLGGLWIGATLIQLYFHRFHEPVPADRAAPPADFAAQGDVVRDPGGAVASVAADAGAGDSGRVEPGPDRALMRFTRRAGGPGRGPRAVARP